MRSIIINMTWKSCTKMFVNTRRFKIRNSKIKIFIFLVFFNSVINSWTSVELSKPWYHQTLSFPGKTESLSLVFVPSVLAPLLKLHLVHKKFVIVNNVIKNGTIFFIYFTVIILSLCKILHNKNQWKTAHYSSFLTFMILYYFSLSLLNCLNIWFVPVAVKPEAAPIIMASTKFVAGIIVISNCLEDLNHQYQLSNCPWPLDIFGTISCSLASCNSGLSPHTDFA